ncbi:MAG: hypothetical protein LUH00_08305 [Lachnospiraceae bacterium]|nr:hypothetical protein [Lachnospiraceae bacterium]
MEDNKPDQQDNKKKSQKHKQDNKKKSQKHNNPNHYPQKKVDTKAMLERHRELYAACKSNRTYHKIDEKVENIYKNIYFHCIKNDVNFEDILANENVRMTNALATSFNELIRVGLPMSATGQMDYVLMWFLSVFDALGVTFSKMMVKTSESEKREIVYSFLDDTEYDWDARGKGMKHQTRTAWSDEVVEIEDNEELEFVLRLEHNDIKYAIYYNPEEKNICLDAYTPEGMYFPRECCASVNIEYDLPHITLYSENSGELRNFFFNSMYNERLSTNTLFKKHQDIKDVLFKPSDKVFRFLSPYISCMSESGKHDFEDILGVVNILSFKTHSTEVTSFYGYYCRDCYRYFIPEEEYQRLKKVGIICCKIIGSTQSEQDADDAFKKFSAESVLHQYGYNVNSISNLSDESRRDILAFVFENEILNRGEIVSHIEMLINLARNRKNMSSAIGKWKSDISFINRYKRTGKYVVDCEAIKVPAREATEVPTIHRARTLTIQ